MVPFPDAWADAWDSYEYTKLAEGQSPNSVRTVGRIDKALVPQGIIYVQGPCND